MRWMALILVYSLCSQISLAAIRVLQSENNEPQNNSQFALTVRTVPDIPQIGKVTKLVFLLKTKDGKIPEVVLSHEKFMHLVVVSKDLSWFSHIHPNRKVDGSFEDEITFPFGGSFKLFALVTPKWERPQRFPLEIILNGDERKRKPLIPKALTHKDGYDYTLHIEPTPVAHSELNLVVTVTKNKKSVPIFQSNAGADARPSGHCIILSEKAERFVHAHPIAAPTTPQAKPSFRSISNELRFNTQFPSPGRYKIWIQFKTGPEKIHTADFVVDIK